MLFSEVLGQNHIKSHLTKSADAGRIPHAQLFVGPEGSGTLPMAIAYAQYILCGNKNSENSEGNPACNLKFNNLSHPDLHFAFPVTTNDKVKRHPVSSHFLEEWRQLIDQQPYGNLFDWYKMLGVDNKQGQIGVDEALYIVNSLSLKSYEGGYKIMLIWMSEKMNIVAEDEEQIISTIRSRCQVLHFPGLSEAIIADALVKKYDVEEAIANKIAQQSNGNFNKACDLVYQDSEDIQFEKWFIAWVRSAFKAKGNKSAIRELIAWSEVIAKTGRETQKQFLQFCINYFRQALLLNYKADDLVYLEPKSESFKLEKFAPFVHDANIIDITKELQDAIYHIERNGNSKIILTDLSIKLTRLLHKKSQANT